MSASSGHEFQAPKSTDKRGECPGLNAAANHVSSLGETPLRKMPVLTNNLDRGSFLEMVLLQSSRVSLRRWVCKFGHRTLTFCSY